MSNCGLPDGVMHWHTERCAKAGRAEGWDEAAREAFDLGLLHDAALEELLARNPHR